MNLPCQVSDYSFKYNFRLSLEDTLEINNLKSEDKKTVYTSNFAELTNYAGFNILLPGLGSYLQGDKFTGLVSIFINTVSFTIFSGAYNSIMFNIEGNYDNAIEYDAMFDLSIIYCGFYLINVCSPYVYYLTHKIIDYLNT